MTFDVLSQLNWLAVIVAGVIYFVLGALWYSPMLFGKAWQRSIGWDTERNPPEMDPKTYIVPGIAYLVMAVAVAMLARATDSADISTGLVLGLVVGVGLSLMHTLVDAAFDPNKPEPWTWFAINGSYHTLGLIITAIIVAAWR